MALSWIVWIILPLGCSSEPETVLPWKDSLTDAPVSPWMWIRENPLTHRSQGRGLEIQLEPGSLMGEGKGVMNILIRPLPAKARMASVTVEFEPEIQYEQAGLIFYVGDDRYIKLVKEFVDGSPWIVMVVEIDTKTTLLQKKPAPEGSVRIAYEWDEKTVTGVYWDGKGERIEVGSGDFPRRPIPRIGLFTQNGNPGLERWARFRDFEMNGNIE